MRPGAAGGRAWPSLLAWAATLPLVQLANQAALLAGWLVLGRGRAFDAWVEASLATPLGVTLAVLPGQAVLLGGALLLAALAREPARTRLGLGRPRVGAAAQVLLLLATLVPMLAGALVAGALFERPSEQLEAIESMVRTARGPWAAYVVTLFSLVPGICEEAFFRGWVQTGLERAWRAPAAIAVSGVLFAAVHVDPMHVVGVLPTALWLSFVRWGAGSLVPSVLCHAFHNLFQVVLLLLAPAGTELGEPSAVPAAPLAVLGVAALAAFLASLRLLLRARRATEPGSRV